VAKAATVHQTECLEVTKLVKCTVHCTIENATYLIFANDKFNNVIPQPRIRKRGALNLTGDNALERCLAEAKDEQN
jgi:hypothetical protein